MMLLYPAMNLQIIKFCKASSTATFAYLKISVSAPAEQFRNRMHAERGK